MASIDRTPTGWKARYRTASGGSRSKTFRRKVEAERFLAGIEHARATGGFVDPALGRRTFGDYAESWLATKTHLAPRTLINIEGRSTTTSSRTSATSPSPTSNPPTSAPGWPR